MNPLIAIRLARPPQQLRCLFLAMASLALALSPLRGSSQALTWQKGAPWKGSRPVVESVAAIMVRENLNPGKEMREEVNNPRFDRSGVPQDPASPALSQWPPASGKVPAAIGPPAFTPGVSWNALSMDESGYWVPPDNMLGVGPSQVLVTVNERIRVFSKVGVKGPLDAAGDNFFASVTSNSECDAEVRFDPLSQRWFVVTIDLNESYSPNTVLIAVSDGPVITTSTKFSFYSFMPGQVGATPNVDTGKLSDRPDVGIDANALYIGLNMFNTDLSFSNTSLYVVRKSSLLGGGPIVVTPFRSLVDLSGNGMIMPTPADNYDPSATVGHIIGIDDGSFGRLLLRTVSDPGGTPSLSPDTRLTVPSTSAPLRAPNPGGLNVLNTDDERIWSARIEKNLLTGRQTLWCGQNIATDSSGVGSPQGDRTSIRWYEIDVSGPAPSLLQAGTLFDPAAANPRFFYYPGIAMNGQGDMLIGAGVSSNVDRTGIAVATRFANDPSGTLRAPATVYVSKFTYWGAALGRWGDYTFSVVDPTDGMTVWTAQQCVGQTDVWTTRVIQLLAPPPAQITSVSPNAFSIGDTKTVTVTGAGMNGSGFFDPGPAFTKHLSAIAGQGGVIVNSVTYLSPTSAKVNLTVGQTNMRYHDLTIVNPDGQPSTLAGALVVSNGPGPYVNSVNLAPSSVVGALPCSATLTLTSPAPSGGLIIPLASSNPSLAGLPASVAVAGNSTTSAPFPITTGPVTAPVKVAISATLNSFITNASLLITPPGASLQATQTTLPAGALLPAVIQLDAPAGPSGANVRITSDSPSITVAPYAFVPPGATKSASFVVDAACVSSVSVAHVTSAVYNIQRTVVFTVKPAGLLSLQVSPGGVFAGSPVVATIKMDGKAPPSGDLISMTYSNPSVASGPARVSVASGATGAPPFTIANSGVSADTLIKVTATFAGKDLSALYTVKKPQLKAFTLSPSFVNGGNSAYATVALTGTVGYSGALVGVSSDNAIVVPPTSVSVFAQQNNGAGQIATKTVSASKTVQITATFGGVSLTRSLIVLPAALQGLSASTTAPIGGTAVSASAILAGLAPTGGLQVKLASSNGAVASVPAFVPVPGLQSIGGFTILTAKVSAITQVTITGTLNGVQKTLVLQVRP